MGWLEAIPYFAMPYGNTKRCFCFRYSLLRLRSVNGAYTGASSTVYAFLGVDYVLPVIIC